MKSLRMHNFATLLSVFALLVMPMFAAAQEDVSDVSLDFDLPSLNMSGLSAIEDDLARLSETQILAQANNTNTISSSSAVATTESSTVSLPTQVGSQESQGTVSVTSESEYRLIVGTSPVTKITNVSALLTGYVAPDGVVTDSYFVYGDTTAMNQETQRIRRSTSGIVQSEITDLLPGTRYYAQHCATNARETTCGIVVSFITATGPETVGQTGDVLEVTEDGAVIEYFEVIIPVPSSFVSLAIQNGVAVMQTGDIITYEVSYSNESDETLRDGTLYIELPADLLFLDTTRGDYSPVDHAISYEFGTIGNNERGTIFVTMELPEHEDDQVPVIAVAHLTHQNPDNGARETATAYDVDTRYHTLAEERAAALAASAFGSGTESTLIITLMAMLAILLIIYYLQSIGMIGGKVVYRTVHVPIAQPTPAFAGPSAQQSLNDFDAIPHPPALVDEVHETEVYSPSYRGHLGE